MDTGRQTRRRQPTVWVWALLAGLAGEGALTAQQTNPYAGDPSAIRTGMTSFRGQCAYCHGMDARGAKGPDLTGMWTTRTEAGVFEVVKRGVPGTEMPPAGPMLPDDALWKTLAYLRTLDAPAPSDPPPGDADRGERIFRAHCISCHRVNGRGGVLGPDLSRIGASRPRVALIRRVRGADEDFGAGYEPVTLTTPDGRVVRAAKKNEDLFSIQVMDIGQRLQGYLRSELREVRQEKQSLMPPFRANQLSDADLDDLVRYLSTLRGGAPGTR